MKLPQRILLITVCLIASACTIICYYFLKNNSKVYERNLELSNAFIHNGGHMYIGRKDLDASQDLSAGLKANSSSTKEEDSLRELVREILNRNNNRDKIIEDLAKLIEQSTKTNSNSTTQQDIIQYCLDHRLNISSGDAGSENKDFSKASMSPASELAGVQNNTDKEVMEDEEILNLYKYHYDNAPVNRWMKDSKLKNVTNLMWSKEDESLLNWQRLQNHINKYETYNSNDPYIPKVMYDMANLPITEVEQWMGGTQIKLRLKFDNDEYVIFKPMRVARDVETPVDIQFYLDYERHTSEIAAFHLDRALGLHRIPPAVGRVLDMKRDIKNRVEKEIKDTFHYSPAMNMCFYGNCSVLCDLEFPICGNPDKLEGSLNFMLPIEAEEFSMHSHEHPWRRSYYMKYWAHWQTNPAWCHTVRHTPPFDSGRRLLDVMDLAVLDFLIGNLDRHHYTIIRQFGNYSSNLILDNGRGLGIPTDVHSLVAPIYQCCMLRKSTYQTLMQYNNGTNKLSDIMRKSLATDVLPEVMTEKQLKALDRRVKTILKMIYKCLQQHDYYKVIIDDGY